MTIVIILFSWLLIDITVLIVAGHIDKLDALMGNMWITWTIMLPITLIILVILLKIYKNKNNFQIYKINSLIWQHLKEKEELKLWKLR